MADALTAIVAGRGVLPLTLARHLAEAGTPFVFAPIEGAGAEVPEGWQTEPFLVERLALFFDRLHDLGVARVVLAGGVTRTRLEPERIDPKTATLLPKVLPALQQGDDALLRAVIGLFEEDGFAVVGAEALVPDLLPAPGLLAGPAPAKQDEKDAARAADLAAMIGAADVGQGAVVAGGQCLALETLPGTDAMLRFVAETRRAEGAAKGVLYKAPKPGQERRVDLPAIGPATIEAAAQAGLAGVVIEAGGVIVLGRAETLAAAEAHGLFLWVRAP